MATSPPDPVPAWVDRVGYPFVSRFVALPAGRLHYVDEGNGEPILFVHGTPTWSYEWRHLIRALSPGWRCVAPDLLGFGLSDRPQGVASSPEAHAAVLAAFVERLGLERITLVVHDYGGPIGLPLCLDRPERVRRLVLVNTWMWPLDDDPALRRKARLASSALGRVLYRRWNASLRLIMPRAYGDRRKLTPWIHRQYLAPFPVPDDRERVLWALARALLGSSAYYADLWRRREQLRGRPVLIIWGLRDPAFGPLALGAGWSCSARRPASSSSRRRVTGPTRRRRRPSSRRSSPSSGQPERARNVGHRGRTAVRPRVRAEDGPRPLARRRRDGPSRHRREGESG